MRRSGLILLSVYALVAGIVAVPVAAAAAVPTAPYTVLGLAVNTGVLTDAGAREASGNDVVVDSTTPTSVAVHGGILSLGLTAPQGTTFALGQTFGIAPTADATHGTATVRLDEHVCNQVGSGSVTVRDIVAGDDDGEPRLTAADVDFTCDGNRWVGYVRLQSSIGYTGVKLTGVVPFGVTTLGRYTDLPVTLTATGTDDLPFISDETVGGANPEAFSVVGDDCKARALPAGTSCTVTVRARPVTAGASKGVLVFVNDAGVPYEVPLFASATDVIDGTYRPTAPQRVLDTRTGVGGRRGPLPAGGVLHLALSRFVPVATTSAVVLNLTVDRPQKPGYLTAYPTGTPRPTASSINFPAGWQGANLVTVPLGANGSIDIYNYLGTTSVIGDLVGVYAKGTGARGNGGGYHPTTVERLLDTRTWGYGKLPGGYSVEIPVSYNNDQRNIGALAVTITAVRPTQQGYLTAWNNSATIPKVSTLNFNRASGVISNAAIVPAAYNEPQCPQCAVISVLNMSSAPIDLVVDINGFFDKGGLTAAYRYKPLASPTRIVDSRSGLGTAPFGPATTRTITAPGKVAGYDTVALDSNITAVNPTQGTFVTVWPTFDDYPRPTASVLNPNARQTIANHAIAEVGYGNKFNLYNAAGTNNLLVDVSGTFELFPHTPTDQIPKQPTSTTSVSRDAPTTGRNVAGVGPTAHAG